MPDNDQAQPRLMAARFCGSKSAARSNVRWSALLDEAATRRKASPPD